MILGSHFRLKLSVLSCFSLIAVHLSGAALTTEPSITAEQYPRRRFQRPRIFFPASDNHTSIITILHVQPNDPEVHKAMPKRLYTRRITLFPDSTVLPIHVSQTPRLTEILCFQMLCFARAFLSYSCVFPVPAYIESSNSKEPLQHYQIGVKENYVCYVLLLPCRHPPHVRCTIDRSVHCSRDSPCRLSFAASDHLPRCRQPRQLHYHHRLSR